MGKRKTYYHRYTIRKSRNEGGYKVIRTTKAMTAAERKDKLWKRQEGLGVFSTKKGAEKEIVYHKRKDKKYGWKGY